MHRDRHTHRHTSVCVTQSEDAWSMLRLSSCSFHVVTDALTWLLFHDHPAYRAHLSGEKTGEPTCLLNKCTAVIDDTLSNARVSVFCCSCGSIYKPWGSAPGQISELGHIGQRTVESWCYTDIVFSGWQISDARFNGSRLSDFCLSESDNHRCRRLF